MNDSMPAIKQALQEISRYDQGNGSCPYGCNAPSLARAAITVGAEMVIINEIAAMDSGNGCCEFGCDCPTIAARVLA